MKRFKKFTRKYGKRRNFKRGRNRKNKAIRRVSLSRGGMRL